ncbi:MAG: GNAT family N-acetyltransferase [Actinomycetota bacterium]|nr:GNAT family N-acetyltransferase [Actinomycetota bacterium]
MRHAAALTHRPAVRADLPALRDLANTAIEELQRGHLTPGQITASHAIMGIDSQLVDDGTYVVVEADGRIAGCGGWSRRATLYGGDHSGGRDPGLLDPERDAARIRAMYTHPSFARRGVARSILETCELAAAAEGFRRLELVATMAGLSLYTRYGFRTVELTDDRSTGVSIPLVRMAKDIPPDLRRGRA